MTRSAVITLVVGVALLAVPAQAADVPVEVNIEFQDFRPSPVDVLPGETVRWSNASQRSHTVTADDGSFDSGDLLGGGEFVHTFGAAGAYPYHCQIHASMTGEVDVRDVILDVLPVAAVPVGQPVEFTGRTADAAEPVTIEQDTGAGFKRVAQVAPAANGTWSANLRATETADFRASSPAGASEIRHMLVSQRRVHARVTRHGVAVTVTPADPYARVRLEVRERERFGWWPTTVVRLDYLSRAMFEVRRPALLRVALIDRDGWTALATSPVVRLRAGR